MSNSTKLLWYFFIHNRFTIPNERGTDEPLGSYNNQTIILSIPADKPDLHRAKWLSIWSEKIKVSLGKLVRCTFGQFFPLKKCFGDEWSSFIIAHINFPGPTLNVPPSLDTIGVEPKVKKKNFFQAIWRNNIRDHFHEKLPNCYGFVLCSHLWIAKYWTKLWDLNWGGPLVKKISFCNSLPILVTIGTWP